MLPFTVEFRPGEPPYEQVMYAVKKALMAGQLVRGDRFPSVRVLSQELKISPNTAHKIVAALTAEGILGVHPGVGTVIVSTSNVSAEARAELLHSKLERLVVEADQLDLKEEQVIAALRRHWERLSAKPGDNKQRTR
jgi:GntR family transcriptional regulator